MKKYWTTKLGEDIKVKQMTTNHIKNTIEFLKEKPEVIIGKIDESDTDSYYPIYGEMINEINGLPITEWIGIFNKELKRRTLCNKMQ